MSESKAKVADKWRGIRRRARDTRRRIGERTLDKWISLYEWRYAEFLSIAGTVLGSCLISIFGGSADRWYWLPIGAIVIVLGLLPTWSKSTALGVDLQMDALMDARESVARDFAIEKFGEAADVEFMSRSNREKLAVDLVEETTQHVWENFFDGDPNVRVLFLAASDDRTRLECTTPIRGRDDATLGFDSTVDGRGEHGVAQLDMDAPYEFCPDTSELDDARGATGRPYVSFISVPVRVGDRGYGLLCADSSGFDEIHNRDGQSLRMYASALEFYLAAAERGKRRGAKQDDNDQLDPAE